MGYDLKPKKKNVKCISVGAFSWPIILQDTGAGYVLGYGAGRSPATYVYRNGNNGSPQSNDGYKVSSQEAFMMAAVMRGYVSVQRFVNKEWEELPEEQRKRDIDCKYDGKPMYRPTVHEDHLKKIEAIADFMERSGGFTIH